MIRRFLCLLTAMLFVTSGTATAHAQLRGYERNHGWEFVLWGEYPYEADGTPENVMWRVLTVSDDVAFMITESIIDFVHYHSEKDTDPERPLNYVDTLMSRFCNEECLSTMFSADEQAALIEMEDGRGKLSCPTFDELTDTATGFPSGKGKNTRRNAWGTPYAYHKGLKKLGSNRCSWYFTATWRRPGFRWIVGDDGHISVVGSDRIGGVRPVIRLDLSKIEIVSGDGTRNAPYLLEIATSMR